MSHIAVLGTGLLGTGFADNLLTKGKKVAVWNRTPDKTAPLAQRGATAAADPAAAVRGASHVHLVLAEDTAVDAVVAALRPGLGAGVPVVDHSTNLPAPTAARFQRLRADGVRYLPAPVFMSPQNAREATGMMVVSGPKADATTLEPHLAAMTGKVFWAGERPDLAAVYKLAGNSLLFAMTAAMSDVLALGRGCDVDAKTMLALLDTFKPGAALPFLGQRVQAANDAPAGFELAMARKDVRLMLQSAGSHATVLLPTIAAAMDRSIARGLGRKDFAVFALD